MDRGLISVMEDKKSPYRIENHGSGSIPGRNGSIIVRTSILSADFTLQSVCSQTEQHIPNPKWTNKKKNR
ncbi:hypothetical protein HF072_02655 [Bacillus sp. RO3]|nr:hypothetical protein [Bacillus sp. RO3]